MKPVQHKDAEQASSAIRISFEKQPGLDFWFTPPASPTLRQPPRWKMTLLTLAALYPVSLGSALLLAPAVGHWPLGVRALAQAALVVFGTGGSDNAENSGGGGSLSIPLGASVPDERGTRFLPNRVLLAAVVLTGTAQVIRAARRWGRSA